MHSARLELPKLTYTRLEDNLIRHRGDRFLQAHSLDYGGSVELTKVISGGSYTAKNTRNETGHICSIKNENTLI